MMSPNEAKIAFVTPSYRGDFERCRLLTESTSMFLPEGVKHYLLIDKRDTSKFKQLTSNTVEIIEAESLLDEKLFRIPFISKAWVRLNGMPVRNWIFQQLLKLYVCRHLDEDIIQFLDSDTVLTKPFDKARLFVGDKVRLQCVDHSSSDIYIWERAASALFNNQNAVNHKLQGNYVGSFITWRRIHATNMIDILEEKSSSSAISAINNQRSFSEYTTYGYYIERILGVENSGHIYDSTPNLHLCWGHDFSTPEGIKSFFDAATHEHIGVMIHSKYGVPIEAYRCHIEDAWNKSRALCHKQNTTKPLISE